MCNFLRQSALCPLDFLTHHQICTATWVLQKGNGGPSFKCSLWCSCGEKTCAHTGMFRHSVTSLTLAVIQVCQASLPVSASLCFLLINRHKNGALRSFIFPRGALKKYFYLLSVVSSTGPHNYCSFNITT